MSELEASKLIKKLLDDIETPLEQYKKSDEYLILNDRLEEIKQIPSSEITEEIEIEEEKIQSKLEESEQRLRTAAFKKAIKNISQQEIMDILSNISESFLEKNNLSVINYQMPGISENSDFGELIINLLNKIENPTNEFYNQLLANEQFTMAIWNSDTILNMILSNTNDAKITLDFLDNYSQEFNKEVSGALNNRIIINKIVTIINSSNYSPDFKKQLLSNKIILSYMNENDITNLITNINIPKEEKIKLLFRPDINEKISEYGLNKILGKLCETIDDCKEILNNDELLQKINIGNFLSNTNLNPNEIRSILLDEKLTEKVNSNDIAIIIGYKQMDFETQKSIIFDNKIFSKLNNNTITRIITSEYLTCEQRLELLEDNRINTILNQQGNNSYKRSINTIINSDIPISDKVILLKNNTYLESIKTDTLRNIMSDDRLLLDSAKEIIFDKRAFYKIIDEQNEEYNPNGKMEDTHKYDKYEYLKKLYQNNHNVIKTINYKLLKDEILDLGFDFIEKISKYPNISANLAHTFEDGNGIYIKNMIEVINKNDNEGLNTELFLPRLIEAVESNKKMFYKIKNNPNLNPELFDEQIWNTITEIGLRDTSLYYKEIGVFNKKEEIDLSLNILPNIETIEDLKYFEKRRLDLCDEKFKASVEKKDLIGAKNAYFNKYFSINIEEAQEIVRLYEQSLQELKNNPNYEKQTSYIYRIKRVMNAKEVSITNMYYNSREVLPFEQAIYMDKSIREMFSEQISNNMYKISDKVKDTNENYITNSPKNIDFVIEENGIKTLKEVPVYEPGFDFKMLIHSTNAYGKIELINDNYFDSWNKSTRKQNHGICCSMISNDNMGMAEVKDVLFGFDSWDPKAISKIAPYDIYSSNDDYEIQEGRKLKFMSAQDLINNTRHTHNELVLERIELRKEKVTPDITNIQPSYVIIYNDMTDEIKQKAIKCSEEMKIPIVYLDKEKIVKHEQEKIDFKINKLLNTTNINDKLDILEQILLSHENNRSGLRITNKDWVDKYFPTSKIDILFKQIISEIQTEFKTTNNIEDYYIYGDKLIDILEKENQKFNASTETTQRTNFIDIPIEKYKKEIIQLVNNNLCKYNTPKLEYIVEMYNNQKTDLPLAKVLSSINLLSLHEQIDDIRKKGLYTSDNKNHNIGHIERIMLFSKIIGEKEFRKADGSIDEHTLDLLIQCAKYHDCGRESDTVDSMHGEKSAQMMKEYLTKEGYKDEDIKIMQAAVEYHAKVDNEERFKKICNNYKIDSSKYEYTKKIANCLKDADALDRLRFKNDEARLDKKMLRLDYSKELIPIAEDLNKDYESFDRNQFYKSCQYLAEMQEYDINQGRTRSG